jgi:hypothetical protein
MLRYAQPSFISDAFRSDGQGIISCAIQSPYSRRDRAVLALDQTSILVASRYLMAHDAAFRAADVTGLTFDDCFVSQGDAKEKQTMRGTKAMAPVEALAG